MPEQVRIPSRYWPAYKKVRQTHRSIFPYYALISNYCLSTGEFRQLGEFITDNITPAQWAEGLERGFQEDTTVVIRHPSNEQEN